jgi:alkyldihydroxyacetonephosphate synthase
VGAVPGTFGVTAHCSHTYRDGGCLYFTLAGASEEPDRYYVAALGAAMEATIAAGGAISHHHGIGVARAPWLAESLGAGAAAVLADVKAALDPAGILNPGKLGLPSPFVPAGWDWTAAVGGR